MSRTAISRVREHHFLTSWSGTQESNGVELIAGRLKKIYTVTAGTAEVSKCDAGGSG